MSLRFHCEKCGKRLQADVRAGDAVACPHCRHTVIVPADAVERSAVGAAAGPPPDEGEAPRGDRLLAQAAMYVPSWGTSVVLHLAIILVALMGTWVAMSPARELDITEVKFEKRPPNVLPPQFQPPSGSRTALKPQDPDHSTFAYEKTNRPALDLADHNRRPVELIGTPGADGGDRSGGKPGLGEFSGPGTGRDPGGWWPPTPDARRIVYVIDHSGSMTDSIMYVKYELRRSIRRLKPTQSFHVIFYSTGPALEMPSQRLLPATIGNREIAYEFIDGIVPVGGTDPSEALAAAFRQKPDVIQFLSDGEFDRKVLDQIDRLNRGHEVRINTVCFIYTIGEPLLMEMAKRTGGTYKYIGEADLERTQRDQ